jgi:hypothetical protein
LIALGAFSGCSGGQTFSAEEFVRDVNREGVKLKLGEPLTTGEEVHAGGSLSVYDEDGAADAEYETCRQAADLLCYQLANVVVVLEGGGLEADQLGVAIKRLAGDE